MCGIALTISGVRIDASSLFLDSASPARNSEKLEFSVDDLKAALRRRGPDSLGCKKVFLSIDISSSVGQRQISSFIQCYKALEMGDEKSSVLNCEEESVFFSLDSGQNHNLENKFIFQNSVAELHFVGATLQLRGINPIVQPLVDKSGNVLVYNGEIFGGIYIASDCNDTEILMKSLEACQCDKKEQSSVPDVLSTIKGPWAIIYWQNSSRTLWFGRDAFGRRSLLVHWPTLDDSTFVLSSVSPVSSIEQTSAQDENRNIMFWEELPCGIYSLSVDTSSSDKCLVGEVKKHEYTSPMLKELIRWERTYVEPKPEDLHISKCKTKKCTGLHDLHSACLEILPSESVAAPFQASISQPAQMLLNVLRESVMRRASMNTIYKTVQENFVPVAVLFSGGLDSMILAALLDECLDPIYEIELLNVSFDGQSAPDRISAVAGVRELRKIAPSRIWTLVEIDADLSNLASEMKHVMSLINPANTYMDLNIGIALWLAATGNGWVCKKSTTYDENQSRAKYESKARIVLVGSGADEQCAGYGRHKTRYRHASWLGLHEEMKLDMQRIWRRNLGRDDRCIADNGKEARFPFLDEDVIRILLDIPLWEVADLDQPSGVGDKKILREITFG
ncbi:Asparagine synthetase domain-containing protein 1 [Quillaja saponaria]|uniref:Asparagine synthetase domain-containing protein 1 n=1 Tax=Quillaja saponaria TaxID=32244 RepID=A0AAD7P638_QUISA|nr:Asparagine synthetase domain-containing protein 1 [Quillaja saponaria]